LVVLAFALGFLRVAPKKQETEEEPKEPNTPPEPAAPEGLEEQDELVNLAQLYADDEEEGPDAAGPESAPETEEVMFDKLCNLKVGRGYLVDCQNLLSEAAQAGAAYALAYFDISRFKFINTLKGFSTGDYVLTRIAQESQVIFPEGSLITRLSGDHYTVLFSFVDDDGLANIFGELRRAAERIRGDIGAKHGIQLCMGVAFARSEGEYDIFQLILKANIARHCNKIAKDTGFSLFEQNMVTSYLFGESSLEDYKELQYSDDFALYITPQVGPGSKRLVSCRAQARWPYEQTSENHLSAQRGGVLPSGNFKVAYQLCKAMSRWRKLDSINLPGMVALSEVDLLMEDVDEFFARCLGEFQLESGLLTVIVSRHVVRLNPEVVLGQLSKLKNIGMKVAISDFERGTQNLELPGEFKPNYLCLQGSFAREIEKHTERQQDTQRVLGLAAQAGCGTIFQEVSTSASMGYFAGSGATLLEGRSVGQPVAVDEFPKVMKDMFKATSAPGGTVVLDDKALGKGDFNVY